jgi:peptide-methionine (S)-S-oxide reductase
MGWARRLNATGAFSILASVLSLACGSPSDVDPTGEPLEPLLPPLVDVPPSADGRLQRAVLAGGCFWSMEAVFTAVDGVVDVVSGYVGGTAETATYDLVAWQGTTDHAEAVEVTFDPGVVSFGQLLQVFFSAAHDPTQVDQQSPDVGREYRSDVFYVDEAQRNVTRAYIDQLDASGLLAKPIATRLDPLVEFFWAEEEHQDFVLKNPNDFYVLLYSVPKLLKLGAMFPDLYRRPWGVAY